MGKGENYRKKENLYFAREKTKDKDLEREKTCLILSQASLCCCCLKEKDLPGILAEGRPSGLR